jgi:hypothetical protein
MKKVLLMAALTAILAACGPKPEDTTTAPATPDTNAPASTNK